MKPLERRLALYLSKKFTSQARHRRYVKDLAPALPIGATDPKDIRKAITRAAQGLLDRRVPTLKSFRFEKSPRTGEWLVVFERGVKPKQQYRTPARAAASLDPEIALLVNDIVAEVGDRDDVLWWSKCAEVLGADLVTQALSQLRDAQSGTTTVRNVGGLLTKILKDLAKKHQLTIH